MDEAGTFSTAADPRTLERDEELALEARSDPDAFGVLYQRHRLAVFRYLRTRTASEDDAADLTAIAFERALLAMPRYRSSGGAVLAWLLRIARNAAIDAGRRTSTVPMLADLADEDRPAVRRPPSSTPSDTRRSASRSTACPTCNAKRSPCGTPRG